MAFEGFAGDGKTYTATQVAVGIHKKLKSKKPIAIFDTEKAAKALLPIFEKEGIEAVVADDQRSLSALNQAIKWCEDGGADILIIDSITHVWEEFIGAYMKSKNRTRLQFEDWAVLKPQWKRDFSNPFVNAKVHIIFSGRAGYEYTDEKNAETGRREIFKSGIKMKAETETAFEPDILVLMEKHLDLLGDKKQVWREATIIKDRTAKIDGKTFKNPTYEDFAPAIDQLLHGIPKTIDSKQIKDQFDDAEAKRAFEKKDRDALVSEIEGAFQYMGLGTSTKDKSLKAAILNKVFSVMSIDGLDKTPIGSLKIGAGIIKEFADKFLTYLKNCADSDQAPHDRQIGELLTEVIDQHKQVASEIEF